MTLDRLIAILMLYGIGGSAAWLIGSQYALALDRTLGAVARALTQL